MTQALKRTALRETAAKANRVPENGVGETRGAEALAPGDLPVDERRKAAAALRRLICEVVSADVDDEAFAQVSRSVEALVAVYSDQARLVRSATGLHDADHAGSRAGREPAYDRDPLIGLSNPLAPPLKAIPGPDRSLWEVTFGDPYEGHPGLVHGGYVAAVLDHILGVVASSSGVASMTGTLTTRYLRPTPLRTRLVCKGEVQRVEGRKVFCHATVEADGLVVVEADGIYIRVSPDRYGSD